MPYVGRKPAGSLPRIDRSHPYFQGMVAFFVFHEGGGTTVTNLVSGITGTFVNGPTWAPDRNLNGGYAINFNSASSQYIDLGTPSQLDMNASGSMAVCASYFHEVIPAYTNYILASKGSQWALDVEGPSNSGRFYVNNGSGGGFYVEGRTTLSGDNRVIGGAWDGANTFGYLAAEGKLVTSSTAIFASLPSDATSTRIGIGGSGGGATNGQIGWVAIWNRYVKPEVMVQFQRDPFAAFRYKRKFILVGASGGASPSSIVANFQSSTATHFNATVTAGSVNITTAAPTASSQHFLATVSGGAVAAGGTIKRGPKELNWKSLAPVLDWVHPTYKPHYAGAMFPLNDGPVPIDIVTNQRMSIVSGSITQVPTSIGGVTGNAISFATGSGTYFSMPNRFRSPTFITLFVICRPNSTQPSDGSRVISTGGYSLEVRHPNTSNQFNLVKEGAAHVQSGIFPAAGVWQVFAATYDTGTKNAFFYNYRYDTQAESTATVNNNVEPAEIFDSTIYIGSAGSSSNAYNGELLLAIFDYSCWSVDKIRALAKNPALLAGKSRRLNVLGVAAAAQTIVANFQSASSTHYNATVSTTASIVANFQSASSTHYNATVSSTYPIVANFQSASSTHYNATVTSSATIALNFQSSGATHFLAVVTQGGIVTNFQASGETHYPATVSGSNQIVANFQSASSQHYSATVSNNNPIIANFQSASATHYPATVSTQATIVVGFQGPTSTHFLPVVSYPGNIVTAFPLSGEQHFLATVSAATNSTDTHDGFLLPIYENPKKAKSKKQQKKKKLRQEELPDIEIEPIVAEDSVIPEITREAEQSSAREQELVREIALLKERIEELLKSSPIPIAQSANPSAIEIDEIDEEEILAVIEAVERWEELNEPE